MKVLPSVSAHVSIPKPFFHVILILIFALSSFAQDYPHSVGPAPQSVYNNTIQPDLFQIGTRAFTQLSTSPTFQFGKLFLESCNPTNIGIAFPITFPGGLINIDGIVYTWNQSSPYQVWAIDTITGVHTIHLNGLTGVPQVSLTGMCWDGVNIYGVSTNMTTSQIFRINWTTGSCTPIGTPSTGCAGAIFLACRLGPGSGLFSVDIVLDNLYKWNKITGVELLVGPLGVNANYGQDACFDNNDGRLYWMSYTTGPQLRRIDTASGAPGPVLCTYSAQATGICTVEPSEPYPPFINACRMGLNVWILDHSTAKDSVFVPLGNEIIRDVNVRIDTVMHTWDSDLRFYLQRGSTGVRIINWVGGSGDNFIRTVLDDEAYVPIDSGTAPFRGSYIPSSPLSVFDGAGSNSYWKLLITDTANGDTGFLRAWCLVIRYSWMPGIVSTIEIPNYYFLNQNHPNPFNPSTIIKFGIPETENVKLIVYDVLGREVKTLLDEVKYPGTYVVDFDGTNLSSGIYFYKLETPNFVQVRKMLFVK